MIRRILVVLLAMAVVLGAIVYALNVRDEPALADEPARSPSPAAPPPGHAAPNAPPARASPAASGPSDDEVSRGAYLAIAGDCVACHTARGDIPFAGGRAIATPFGTVYSTNLTPDPRTGLGRWTRGEFYRALHNGRSKDGRLLYPAFPYPNFTQVTRSDADALYAWLRTLPPVERANRPNDLRFPYNTTVAIATWRALFFRPGTFAADDGQSAEWNRGAYLARGLGHCDACHAERNALGAVGHRVELGGGLIPEQNWYAPPLTSAGGAGVADWETADVVDLLRGGISRRGVAMGPMAEVVFLSTQHLHDDDLRALTAFLKSLPQATAPERAAAPAPDPRALSAGRAIYDDQCAACHGKDGEGTYPAYPALAGNRTVNAQPPANAIRAVVEGGYLPATAANPRPYGMPPFVYALHEAEIAAVLTYVRSSWGNQGGPVTTFDVQRYR